MKYPRYRREQKANAKLTDEQARRIVEMWKSGATKTQLAQEYGVTIQAIAWICLSPEERARRTRIYNKNKIGASYTSKERRAAVAKKVREKKYALISTYQDYERSQSYANRHDGVARPTALDTMPDQEKKRLAGVAGGEVTKKKGSSYYRDIVNKRWGKPFPSPLTEE